MKAPQVQAEKQEGAKPPWERERVQGRAEASSGCE